MAGTVKAYNLTIDYVLYEMSYANMVMYGAVLPSPKHYKDREKGGAAKDEDIIRADNPNNKQRVRDFLNSITD